MSPSKKQQTLAHFFDALGHKRRQMIFTIIFSHGEHGMPLHALIRESRLIPATLSFHLKKLESGRILKRKEKGRETWLSIDQGQLQFLLTEFGATMKKGPRNGAALLINPKNP